MEGEVRVDIAGIPLATAKVPDGRIRIEARIVLDANGTYAARTWIDDDVIDVDVDWFTALEAGVLTAGLFLLGAVGLAHVLEDEINALIPPLLQDVVARADRDPGHGAR
jgi:hypothetical protein